MARTLDVANYFVSKSDPNTDRSITHLKLQKLLYYAHAWHLVIRKEPLVEDGRFEAWMHGPVNPILYYTYREYGYKQIVYSEKLDGDNEKITDSEREVIDLIWKTYGHLSGKDLENLTHNEEPWKKARQEQGFFERGNNVIHDKYMLEYYQQL